MNKTIILLLSAASLVGTAWASGDHGKPVAKTQTAQAQQQPAPAAPGAPAAMTEGQVTKVDADNNKLTLRHGEIKNLEMPPMTMVFQVQDPAMLQKVKTGDKVRFTADKVNGAITVTSIEIAK